MRPNPAHGLFHKVLLGHHSGHLFRYCLSLTVAVQKAKILMLFNFCRKNLPIPVLVSGILHSPLQGKKRKGKL